MKNSIILFLTTSALIIILATNVNSQIQNGYCGMNSVYEDLLKIDPEILENQKKQEEFTESFIDNHSKSQQPTYVIPVVVHIFHNYGSENIPDANVYDMLRIVNEDFQANQPDTGQIAPPFKPILGGMDIEFRLATKDPNGNCTNGINRVYDPVYTNRGGYLNGNISSPAPVRWPRDKYLNIWVVNMIDVNGQFLGYSAFPSFPADRDGVTIQANVFGSLPPSSTNNFNARYMSHEIGHSLNLFHTWGNGGPNGDPGNCNFDDNVQDTPNTIGTSSCTNLSFSSCGSIDNNQNIMDYGYGNCPGGLMFTVGQTVRAEAALNGSTGGRNNLWSAANLLATGTDSLSYANPPVCVPIADFNTPDKLVCEGSTVSFRDESFNAAYDANTWSYNWSFPGGTPSSSTARNPVITYNNPGVYDVSLTVSNSAGTSPTITKSSYITVLPGSGTYVAPYLEQIDDSNWPNNSDSSLIWTNVKAPGSLYQFQRTTNAFYSPPSSAFLNNFAFNGNGQFDLISPQADLTNMQAGSAYLNFQIAHSQKSNETETLFLFVSEDCGQSFSFEKAWPSTFINSSVASNNPFFPADTTEWKFLSHDISDYAGKDNIQFMFRFNANSGNNLFLDDIHISDSDNAIPVGLREDLYGEFNLYPNPNEGIFTLEFYATAEEQVNAEIVDMIGKRRKLNFNQNIVNGWNSVDINTQDYNLNPGIYFLKLESGDQVFSKRLIIE